MATFEWITVPWRVPSPASVKAVLDRLGYVAFEGEIDIDPSDIEDLSVEDNRVLSAGGIFGTPQTPWPGADYSEFSGVSTKTNDDGTFTTAAYDRGKEIGSVTTAEPTDTVAYWESLQE